MYAPPPWIGGITAGILHSTNVAKINLISTAATANSEIEFGDNISGGLVKLQATPSDGASVATNFKIMINNAERLKVQNDATTITGGLTVAGNAAMSTLTCSGDATFGNIQCGTMYSAGFLPSNHTFSGGLKWEWCPRLICVA